MKFSKLLLAASFVLPALALAQATATQSKPDMKASFGVLDANVAKITAPMEKERWTANREAWEVEVTKAGKLQKVDLGKIMESLDRMKANVEKIRGGSEKERWQANIELWQLYVSHAGALGKADAASVTASFDKMKYNVENIKAPVERERWQANRDLWLAMIERTGTK